MGRYGKSRDLPADFEMNVVGQKEPSTTARPNALLLSGRQATPLAYLHFGKPSAPGAQKSDQLKLR